MSNYIDKDKLIRDLIDNRNFYPTIVKNAIEQAPTEDVVPRIEIEKAKQEVAREIFEVINDIVESWKVVEYSKETGDVIRTSYNGTMITKCLAELKKKYIGE